jgi:hypothetical protein
LEDVRSLQASLEAARAAIKAQSKECAVTIDTTSVGDRDVEQEMLYLADLIEVYELKSGTRPNNVADLEKLKEAEINGNVKSLEKACTISFDLKNGGYALSCGPTRASISELGSFLDNVRLGGNVQKFLKISGKEILYIPPRKC